MQLNIRTTATLNNKVQMPLLGLGVYQTGPGKETFQAVTWALQAGYRHIDTAAYYQNEGSVGEAIRKSGIQRKDIFVTTKLANHDQDHPVTAFNASLKKLGKIDLYLIHWPMTGKRQGSWKALEDLYYQKKVRAIGVSNYTIKHLKELLASATVVPAVNQVEFSPFLYQKELHNFCTRHKIQLEAYSPLTRGKKLADPRLVAIAKKHKKTPAQVLIRWALQHGIVVIPKSVKEDRIRENCDVYGFALSAANIKAMDCWNEDFRTCWDPKNVA